MLFDSGGLHSGIVNNYQQLNAVKESVYLVVRLTEQLQEVGAKLKNGSTIVLFKEIQCTPVFGKCLESQETQ